MNTEVFVPGRKVPAEQKNQTEEAFTSLEESVFTALETYSNVHRGSGHFSRVTTRLFDQTREIVLEYLGLDKHDYAVLYLTPRRAAIFRKFLPPESFRCVTSRDIGLPLGIEALAVRRKALPPKVPFQSGGGTARLVAPGWVIRSRIPDRFEAGTPAIINIIALARALQIIRENGNDVFKGAAGKALTSREIPYHDEPEELSGKDLLNKLRMTCIGSGFQVQVPEGSRPFINLDNAASTPALRPVWEAVCNTWRQPEHVHREIIRDVSALCAEFLGASPENYEVIFASNTTEAINLAAESLSLERDPEFEPVVVNTLLEHNSNEIPWREISGTTLIRLKVNPEGFVDTEELERQLNQYNKEGRYGKKRIRLVAVSGASNVLGTFNNLQEISRIVHLYGARLLVDAAQLVAHRKVEMENWGVDYLALSGHKVYAPFGTGVLVVRKGLLCFNPAGMDLIRSSGEENVVGIAALGKSLHLLQKVGFDLIREEEQALTRKALEGMSGIPGLKIHGIKDPDSPQFMNKGGVIPFEVKGMMSDKVAKELDSRGGIGVRAGCHCAHMLVKWLVQVPPVFEQIQGAIILLFRKMELPGVVRVSIGIENTGEDIDILVQTLKKIAKK